MLCSACRPRWQPSCRIVTCNYDATPVLVPSVALEKLPVFVFRRRVSNFGLLHGRSDRGQTGQGAFYIHRSGRKQNALLAHNHYCHTGLRFTNPVMTTDTKTLLPAGNARALSFSNPMFSRRPLCSVGRKHRLRWPDVLEVFAKTFVQSESGLLQCWDAAGGKCFSLLSLLTCYKVDDFLAPYRHGFRDSIKSSDLNVTKSSKSSRDLFKGGKNVPVLWKLLPLTLRNILPWSQVCRCVPG